MKIPKWLSTFAKAVECAIEQHKAVTRLTLAWVMALITYATIMRFLDGGDAASFAALCGLLSVVVGFYTWRAMR